MDWRALKDVVTVAETGSLSAAARRLYVSQPTVGRRIELLEHQLGVTLFNRTAQGLSLTQVGEDILQHAKSMEEGSLAIERLATGANQQLQGKVRISLVEDLGILWLPEKLSQFHCEYPQLAIEVDIDNRNVDLLRREADIAVRLARPEQADLICRKVGLLNFALYASQSYLQEHGEPKRISEMKEHYLVGYDEQMANMAEVKKLESLFLQENIRHRSNNHMVMVEATRAGLGCAPMCCFIGDAYPELRRILAREITYAREIWLVTHAEINSSARIRAAFDFLAKELGEDAGRLQGLGKNK